MYQAWSCTSAVSQRAVLATAASAWQLLHTLSSLELLTGFCSLQYSLIVARSKQGQTIHTPLFSNLLACCWSGSARLTNLCELLVQLHLQRS